MERADGSAPLLTTAQAWCLYGALSLVAVAPVFAVLVPALGDTLNHLARIDIMARLGTEPALRRFYQAGWRFVPYYGMDVPVLLLARILPIYRAGQIFVAACVLMPVAAIAILRLALYRRIGLVPILGFVFGYNLVLAFGFLNYLFSVCLAVMLFAGWIAAARWRWWTRPLLFSVCLILLYLCHAFAAASYCLMVAGYEFGRAARSRFRPMGAVARNWIAAAAQLLPLSALILITAARTQIGSVSVTAYGSAANRVAVLLSPFFFPDSALASGLAIMAALAGLPLLRLLRVSHVAWPAACTLCIASILVPKVLLNVWGSDLRLPIVAVILVLACLSRGPRIAAGSGRIILAAAVCLAMLKSAQAYRVLAAADTQVGQMRSLVAALPRGSRLLVVELDNEAAPQRIVPAMYTGHLAMVAAIDRDCFLPFLFTGVTAVQLRPALVRSGSPNGGPIGVQDLWDGLAHRDAASAPAAGRLGGQVYWLDWPMKFDDVLIEHFGAPIPALPAILHRIGNSPIADLYRIGGS